MPRRPMSTREVWWMPDGEVYHVGRWHPYQPGDAKNAEEAWAWFKRRRRRRPLTCPIVIFGSEAEARELGRVSCLTRHCYCSSAHGSVRPDPVDEKAWGYAPPE